jgi:tRNA(Ile)-lysidine synthase
MSTESNFLERLETGLTLASVPNGASLIVAFSGGPDSSALLSGLTRLKEQRNLTLLAAHVNHQISPESSNDAQTAAEHIAKSLGVEFTAITIDVPAIAAVEKISIESAARRSRYLALTQIVNSNDAFGVVTGHTRDDQAETVLLHAARGAGLKGISGMSYNSILKIPESNVELNVLRPMLDTPRTDCIQHCEDSGIDPVIDESNSNREYTRNKIRLDILPLLNDAAPAATDALARLAKNASDDLETVEWVVEQHITQARISNRSYARSATQNIPESLVARMLMRAYEIHVGHSQDLQRVHVLEMVRQIAGRSGTSIELPNGTRFFVDKEAFGFASPDDDDCPFPDSIKIIGLPLPGSVQLDQNFSIKAEIIDRPTVLDSGDSNVIFATPNLLQHALTLRNRKNGDRFQPLGMTPKTRLQDFFVGAGVPERWRNRVPIVDSSQGIVWVAGYRLAEWAKVKPLDAQVVRLELVGSKER